MQTKNFLIFGAMAVLLVGGTILPAMSQTESEQQIPQIELSLDSSSYDLNERITISGQIIDYVQNTRDPSLDLVHISFLDNDGKAVSSSGYGHQSGTYFDDADKPFTFSVWPDKSGNFALSTVLTSVLFNYGSYNAHAITYQSGNIEQISEFEIVPTVEEELVVIEDPIVFEFCKTTRENVSTDEIMKDFANNLDSIECLGDNNFNAGDKMIIKGTVNTDDTNSVSRVSGENKQEQSSQGAPSFVKVSIPYSKAMILDTPRDYSTTTGTPIPVDRTSEIDSMTLQLLPDEAGSFNGIFNLPQTVFDTGLYTVVAFYEGHKFEQEVRIIDTTASLDGEAKIVVTTDKSEYQPGETVQITGQIQNSFSYDVVTIFIETPDVSAYNCMIIDCLMDSNEKSIHPESGLTTHTFSWNYQLTSSEASLGVYKILAGSSVLSDNAEITFFVTEELAPSEPVVTEEEAPKIKKIIKKFNRISDSNILITLDDMEQDSELAPRVIQGSLFTAARGQEANVNIQVSSPSGKCVIGQDIFCMINESTRKPGAIYEIVTIGEMDYKVRYSGHDVKLEKFSILPNSSGTPIEIQDWNVEVIKEDQPTRFYYKVSYVDLG